MSYYHAMKALYDGLNKKTNGGDMSTMQNFHEKLNHVYSMIVFQNGMLPENSHMKDNIQMCKEDFNGLSPLKKVEEMERMLQLNYLGIVELLSQRASNHEK